MKGEKETFVESSKVVGKVLKDLPYPDEHGKIIRLNKRFVLLDISYLPFDILSGMDELLGPVSKTILFRIGRRWGSEIYRRYESMSLNKFDCLNVAAAVAWYTGWGLVTFEVGKEKSRARIYNCFEAESTILRVGVSPENSCRLFTGVIAGIYDRFLGKPCSISEEKCAARGDGYCELVATPGTEEQD